MAAVGVEGAERPDALAPVAKRLAALERRLGALERRLGVLEAVAIDSRRRHLLSDLRRDPGRYLAGVAQVSRVVPEELDELSDVLSRWDVPLSVEERAELQRAALVAQAVAGPSGNKVYLVVEAVSTVTVDDVERAARRSRVFAERNRRAIPVVVCLEPPSGDLEVLASRLGVELSTDSN